MIPRYRRWIWWVAWVLYSLVRPFLCRIRIEGSENLPTEGGAVIACNHNNGPDFVLLAFSSPREVSFMAKAEIFAWNPILTAILRAGGVFPVVRGAGDGAAIETAVELASEGNLIAMFPEGTRSKSGKLMRGKTGAARIALAAGVPIVPVAITNSALIFKRKGWQRPLVTVRFGEPVTWRRNGRSVEDESETARAYTDAVMREIAAMLPVELRGEYGGVTISEATGDKVTAGQ